VPLASTAEAGASVANAVLRDLRLARGWSQADVARRLNALADERSEHGSLSEGTVGRWERGEVRMPEPLHRQLLAELFGVSLEELGYFEPSQPGPRDVGERERPPLALTAPRVDHHVEQSQQDWRAARRHLNGQRVALTISASRLYEPELRIGSTGTLARSDWRPPAPVDLASVSLEWVDQPASAAVNGQEEQTAAVRPLAGAGRRFARYTHALRAVDPPALFENRVSYRLLDVAWTASGGRLKFGPTTYFENVDVNEAVAHELAAAQLTNHEPLAWRGLPFRRLIGNPFDLARRPLLPSIDTLTLRRDRSGGASMVLHQRDAARVAVAGGMFHVMPAGVFQPASIHPTLQDDDFDLWRSMMREYSEEFLGNPDHDGTGPPVGYDLDEPFVSLDRARRDGLLRAWCFGIGLDALTLNGEILTAVVFDAEVFDDVFADLVERNSEGAVVAAVDDAGRTRGLPFTEHQIHQLLGSGTLAPAAAACLQLAWAHRDVLLDASTTA